MTTDLQEIVRCTTDQPPPEFWVSVEDAKRLTDELRRLEAIVDKLPKTADGVTIIPGMPIILEWGATTYCPHYTDAFAVGPAECHPDGEYEPGSICIQFGDGSGLATWKADRVFSTREAAEAAKEKNPHGD